MIYHKHSNQLWHSANCHH